jgi:prepilin-type processing-associated H-X9-DG protein
MERLLPFAEAQTVYNRICMNAPNFSPICLKGVPCPTKYCYANSGCPCVDPCAAKRPAAAVIPSFVCPSAPRANNPFVDRNQFWQDCVPCFSRPEFTRLVGAKDYIGLQFLGNCVLRHYAQSIGKRWQCVCGNGNSSIFCISGGKEQGTAGGTTIDQITDGTSTTIFCTEYAGAPDWWVRGGKQAPPTRLFNFNPNPGGAWAFPESSAVVGSNFTGLARVHCTSLSCPAPVCFFNCSNEFLANAFFGFHPGTAGVAMCDGSARMLSENLSVVVFGALFTPRGHERVTDQF